MSSWAGTVFQLGEAIQNDELPQTICFVRKEWIFGRGCVPSSLRALQVREMRFLAESLNFYWPSGRPQGIKMVLNQSVTLVEVKSV